MIHIPAGIPIPQLTYDASDDSVQFEVEALRPIFEANPDLEWAKDTVASVLAVWLLRELDQGRRPDPVVAEVLLSPVRSDSVH